MDRSNDSAANGGYRYPQYGSPRPQPPYGRELVPTRRLLQPQSSWVDLGSSRVLPGNAAAYETTIGQTPTAIAPSATLSAESQQQGDTPDTRNQAIGQRPVNLVFPSPFIQPIIRPSFMDLPRNLPDDDGYIPMGRYPNLIPSRFLHPEIWEAQLRRTGISHNYGGNIFLEANQSANVPFEQSTSLWLTNLPPDCTHRQLLGAIRGCGKIFAAVINPPVKAVGGYNRGAHHMTSASKLVFFDRTGLDRLVAKSQAGEFSVGGFVPRIRLNRIKSAPRAPGRQSRVLHIWGPSSIVNETYLNNFFQTKFTYELDRITTIATADDWTLQEWRFGSFRCQAEAAHQSISREKRRQNMSDMERLLWSNVMVEYGVDPCA
ncbi:hypothetical protein F5Y05DRAFT_403778 [Hypoxylon sp. FL0543]|nr:hypothetical protein F5Y05DRAFT_403778 [Hypoxylon sp. FL0543]